MLTKIDLKLDIVYEDDKILAIFKPTGIHSQGGSHNKESLADIVAQYLNQKSSYLLNRLDTPVSGIVLFAKDKYSARLINRTISKHTMKKHYIAIVFGIPKIKENLLEEQIIFDTKKNYAKIKATNNSKTAILKYKFIKSLGHNDIKQFNNTYSLIEIELITGRKHQIRAQLANIGHPILFDSKYYQLLPKQDRELFQRIIKIKNNYIKLMAYKVEFNNPLNNGKKQTIELKDNYIKEFTNI